MRLAILSPLNRSGCSVVTTMLAQGAALTQDWKTVVTYTSKARTLPIYSRGQTLPMYVTKQL